MELDKVYQMDALELLTAVEPHSVDAVITDPPYGVGRPSQWTDSAFEEIANNDVILVDWIPAAYAALKDGGAMYTFANWQNEYVWRQHIQGAGFKVRGVIVWDKIIHGAADLKTCYAPQYELVIFAAKGRHILHGARPHNIIRALRVAADKLKHPYEKPVELLRYFISKSTVEGALVCDPFAGSGATLQAARDMGRRFIGCDIDAAYVAMARERVSQPFTVSMF